MREWNAAIEHIEDRLTEQISGIELANIALTSEYHFRRMFATLTGMQLASRRWAFTTAVC